MAGSDVVGLRDGLGGAVLLTSATANALLLVDFITHELLADASAAFLVNNVLNILIPEVVEGRKYRVR